MPYGLPPTANRWLHQGGVLSLCRRAFGVFYSPSQQGGLFSRPGPSNYCLFVRPQKNAPGKRFGSNEKVISETEAKDKSFYKKDITQEEDFVEFCLKVVVLLVRPGTY